MHHNYLLQNENEIDVQKDCATASNRQLFDVNRPIASFLINFSFRHQKPFFRRLEELVTKALVDRYLRVLTKFHFRPKR